MAQLRLPVMTMAGRLLATLLVNVLALWVAAAIFDGIRYADAGSLIAAGAVLGIVNFIVRPLVTLLTLPIVIVTLGIWLLAINAAMLGLVSWLVGGFSVSSFWTALGGAIVIGLVNWTIGSMLRADDRRPSLYTSQPR